MNPEIQEAFAVTIESVARSLTEAALVEGMRPAHVIEALTEGFEKGLAAFRDGQDRANAGH